VHRSESLEIEFSDDLLPAPTAGLANKLVTSKIVVYENLIA